MRVLFVAPNIPVPGTHGGATHVTEVVNALRQSHDVMLLARRGSHGPQVVGFGLGTAPGPLAYALALLHWPQAYVQARRFRPDVIYERFSAHGLGVLLGKALGVPVLSMVLDTDATQWTLKGADRLITTAPHLIAEPYRKKTTTVSWGANTERFKPGLDAGALRRRLGFSSEQFVVAYTGAFYPWHGLETLVAAAERLRGADPNSKLRFLLVGDGSTRAEIEALIRRARLESWFVSVGKVAYESVPEYLAVADACVAPYNPARHPKLEKHGMFFDPLKVFEYLACGKPTVTLASENLRRIFQDQVHALLVPPGDAEALARAIDKLHADRGFAAKLGVAGRQLVEQKYSWKAHADQLTTLFEELVAERAGS